MRTLIDDLMDVMPTSKENAVTQRYLSDILHVTPRTIRETIRHARIEGYPICCNHENGYWYSMDKEDLKETIYMLQEQRNTLNATIISLWDTYKRLNSIK